MKLRNCLGLALILGVNLAESSVDAHPYDSPLEFRLHKTDDGRNIYTNIPKKCFHGGVLTCTRLHPIFSNKNASESAEKPQTAPQ